MRTLIRLTAAIVLMTGGAGNATAQGSNGNIALLLCDISASSVPTVRSLHTGNPGFCDGSSNLDFCEAVDGIEEGQSCAEALAPLLAAGGAFLAPPVAVPLPHPSELLLIREDDALAILGRGVAPSTPTTDLLFVLQGNDVRLVGCDVSGLEPIVTFEQPEPDEPSEGTPCAEVVVRDFDPKSKAHIVPSAGSSQTRIWGDPHVDLTPSSDEPASTDPPPAHGVLVVYTITVENSGP